MSPSLSTSLRADYGGALHRCVAIFGWADQHSAGPRGGTLSSLKYINKVLGCVLLFVGGENADADVLMVERGWSANLLLVPIRLCVMCLKWRWLVVPRGARQGRRVRPGAQAYWGMLRWRPGVRRVRHDMLTHVCCPVAPRQPAPASFACNI
eukprot:scaffold4914_cov137-Isochrysis_galbana.AAC.2